jgi:hypothetical protein
MKKQGLMAKKIPTVFGILILLGGLVAGVILVNNRQGLITKAGPTESPKNVKISNLGSNSFTVSWTTDTPVTGYLKYSENPAKITSPAGDIRDQISGTSQGYTNHYITVTGLSPEKTVYFMIGSGSQMYDDNGNPFEVRTTNQVIAPPENVITGKIVGADGTPINGAIVYVEVEGGKTLSAMTNTTGAWRLNLASSRDSKGAVLTYDANTSLVSIFVQAGISGTATAVTNTSKTKPVPDITLGKNQSFVDSTITSESASSAVAAGKSGSFESIAEEAAPVGGIAATESGSMIVMNPAINGEIIATSTPEFRGKTAPGITIKISVHSPIELTQVIKSDKNGDWTWTPPQKLDPGLHTLTLEFTDENNVFQKIVRTFTVLAAEDTLGMPAFVATPSSEIATPSAIPTESMPATVSSELADAGGFSTTILLGVAGIIMLIFGKVYKNKWKD